MKPRAGKHREVSYLSDGLAMPSSAGVPKSVIPEAFRIVLESPLPHKDPSFYSIWGDDSEWKYNSTTRQWEAVLFPSKVPAGRSDVLLLHAWVNDMVKRLKGGSEALGEEGVLKDAQLLFSVAFHEITRQVSVHCLERGHLMGKIWWSQMEVFQRLTQLRAADQAALAELRRENANANAERDALKAQVAELQQRLRTATADAAPQPSASAATDSRPPSQRPPSAATRARLLARATAREAAPVGSALPADAASLHAVRAPEPAAVPQFLPMPVTLTLIST